MKYPVLFENSILTKRKNGEYSTYSWIDFFVILRVIIRILPRNNYLLIVPALRYFHVIRRSGIHKETCSRCAESVSTGKVVEWRRHCALVRLERGVFPCKCMRPWHRSRPTDRYIICWHAVVPSSQSRLFRNWHFAIPRPDRPLPIRSIVNLTFVIVDYSKYPCFQIHQSTEMELLIRRIRKTLISIETGKDLDMDREF